MDTIVIKKSELIEQIREDFKLWEEMSPDIDEGYFDEEDVQSYLNFLIERYLDEWFCIDDIQEGGDVCKSFSIKPHISLVTDLGCNSVRA